MSQLPILQVMIPLICAPLCVLVRHGRWVWLLACVGSLSGFLIAGMLFFQVIDQGRVSHLLGGWPVPLGIELRVDRLGVLMLLLVTALASLILGTGRALIEKEIAQDRVYLFYTCFLLNLAGISGVLVTGDVFNLYVFIEIASLSSYAMISIGRKRRALFSAYQYLIYGTIGASFILIAVGLLYALTGTLNMSDLATKLATSKDSSVIKTALAFFSLGIMLKCAIFPFHIWLPGAYGQSPTAIAAFFAGTTTKVFLYVLIRFLYSLFGVEFSFQEMRMDWIFMTLAVCAMFYGGCVAMRQDNIRYLLAWSSISQIGYMLLAVSLGSPAGLAAALVFMCNHALTKTGLFMTVAVIEYRHGTASLRGLRGMARHSPWLAACFVTLGLSLVGMPLTAGFISKWLLFFAAVEQGIWVLLPVILFSSLLALVYVWKAVEVLYDRSALVARDSAGASAEAIVVPHALCMSLPVFVLAVLILGVGSAPLQGFADAVAHQLLYAG